MKQYLINKYSKSLLFSVLLILVIAIFSCTKDESTLNVNPIDGVVFDTTGTSVLRVYQFDTLKVNPSIQTDGIPSENLEYEWRINRTSGDTLSDVIGTEPDLSYPVEVSPTVTDRTLQILLTVTDNSNGLQYKMLWPLIILNNIGEGLVIAETPDGQNTDISHIMSPEVTSNYNSQSIKYNVYSAINEGSYPGITKQLLFGSLAQEDVLLGITDESLYRINTLDYTLAGQNDDLFAANKDDYRPQRIDYIFNQTKIYVGEGQLTAALLTTYPEFGVPFDFSYEVPDEIAINKYDYSGTEPSAVMFFEENLQRFIYMAGISQFSSDKEMRPVPSVPNAPFEPDNFENTMTNVASATYSTGGYMFLLREINGDKMQLYQLDQGVWNYPDPSTPPAPVRNFDLSDAPEIAQAEHFVFLDDQRVLFYATDRKIYAVLYNGVNPVFEERYTAPVGETITTLQVYQQASYPNADNYLPLNNRALVASTYDGAEGRVYLLPYINQGVANIDVENIKVFEGFDRITTITTQL